MAKVLLRQVFQRGDSRTLHDLELDVGEITIGSDGDNVLSLSDISILPQHARITLRKTAALRSLGSAALELNGQKTSKANLQTGDRIVLGSYIISVIEAPAGFEFALLVEQERGRSASAAAGVDASAADDSAPWPLQRSLVWVAVLTLFLTFLAPSLSRFLDRGELADRGPALEALWATGPLHPAHHAATGNDCAACHGGAFDRIQDASCLSCHETTGAHAELAVLTEREQHEGTCKSCHEEHQGDARLVDGEGFVCASCHETGTLGQGHPEFTLYPKPDRPRIIFDHQAHKNTHFSKTDKQFECAGCHSLDAAGVRQVTGSFEKMCLDCHDQRQERPARGPASKAFHHGDQIVNSDPVAMFTLPNVDLRSVEDASVFGVWPEGTRKGDKSQLTRLGLTPMSEFLLMLDPTVAPALARLKAHKIRLSKLKRVDAERLADVAAVLWGVKRLLLQMADDPAAALRTRLAPVVGGGLSERDLAALSGRLQGQFLLSAAVDWFGAEPGSLRAVVMQDAPELAGNAANKKKQRGGSRDESAQVPGVDWVATGDWNAKKLQKYSLQYEPAGHADSFVRAWLDLSAQLAGPDGAADEAAFDVPAAATALLDSLADTQAAGGKAKGAARCSKCHSTSDTADGGRRFNWSASLALSVAHQRAWFAHAPHVKSGESAVCGTCHQLDESSELLAAYGGMSEPTEFISSFSSLEQTACSSCHGQNGGAGQACTTCHNYHVVPRTKGGH